MNAQQIIADLQRNLDMGRREYVAAALHTHLDRVNELQDPELDQTYGLARLFVGDLSGGISYLTRSSKRNNRHAEALGILNHEAGRYDVASAAFSQIIPTRPVGRLAMASSLHRSGTTDLGEYLLLLDPITPLSAAPNTMLGVLHHNQGHYDGAITYFDQALEFLNGQEPAHIRALTPRFKRDGGLTDDELQSFYHQTGSIKSLDELNATVDTDKMSMPRLQLKGNIYTNNKDILK